MENAPPPAKLASPRTQRSAGDDPLLSQVDLDFASHLAEQSAGDISSQLQADMKRCFDQLSTKLLEEIRDLLSNHTSHSTSHVIPVAGHTYAQMQMNEASPRSELQSRESSKSLISLQQESGHTLEKAIVEEEIEEHVNIPAGNQYYNSMVNDITKQADDVMQILRKQEESRQRKLYRLVDSHAFASLCLFLIFANALWMGYELDTYPAVDERMQDWDTNEVVNLGFTVWFCVELLLRGMAQRKDFLFGPDAKWNVLDLTVVVLSIPDVFVLHVDVTSFRLYRIVRLARVLRMFRVLEYFPRLQEILVTVLYTFESLFWSFVAIMLVAYVFACLIGNSIKQAHVHGAQFDPKTEENFKTVLRSMLALFSLISSGQEWYDFVDDFRRNDDHVAQYALLCWVFFMMFGFMNIVVAVFCSNIAEASEDDYGLRIAKLKQAEHKKIEDLMKIFQMIDTTKSGAIDWGQFWNFAKGSEGKAMLRFYGIQPRALPSFWESINMSDPSRVGVVGMTAFVMGFLQSSGGCTQLDIMMLQQQVQQVYAEIQKQQLDINKILCEQVNPFSVQV